MKVTTDAVQVLGGYGYTRDFPVERFMSRRRSCRFSRAQARFNELSLAGILQKTQQVVSRRSRAMSIEFERTGSHSSAKSGVRCKCRDKK